MPGLLVAAAGMAGLMLPGGHAVVVLVATQTGYPAALVLTGAVTLLALPLARRA